MKLTKSQRQWLAGVIDSEGYVELRRYAYIDHKRNRKREGNTCQIRIATCDNIIAPTIARWFGLSINRTRKSKAGNTVSSIILRRNTSETVLCACCAISIY